jgi:hypothetical protein
MVRLASPPLTVWSPSKVQLLVALQGAPEFWTSSMMTAPPVSSPATESASLSRHGLEDDMQVPEPEGEA